MTLHATRLLAATVGALLAVTTLAAPSPAVSTGTVTGTVEDSGGRPIADIDVQLLHSDDGGLNWSAAGVGTTDAAGRWSAAAVPGSYRVCASATNHAWLGNCPDVAAGPTVAVTGGQTTAAAAITLDRNGFVSGRLTYHVDGTPVPNAQVVLWTQVDPGSWAVAASMNTRADGTYEVGGDAGAYKLCVSLNLYRTARPACWTSGGPATPALDEFGNVADPAVGDDVTIGAPGTERANVDLALVGGRIGGTTYRAADHSPLPNSVTVWTKTPGGLWEVAHNAEDPDGAWSIHLEPGTYWYCVYGNDGELWEPRCWNNVAIPVKDPHYYPDNNLGPMPGSSSVALAADQIAPSFAATLQFRGFELVVEPPAGTTSTAPSEPVKSTSGKPSKVAVRATAGKRKATLRISVTAKRRPVTGRVLVVAKGRTLKNARLSRKGTVTVRLVRQPRGRQTYTVVYLGKAGVRWSQRKVTVRVR